MPRLEMLLVGLITLTSLAAGGCRSCSSCHDYDPPVAGCQCDACGTHRAGSACSGGCTTCSGGTCTTGSCNCGNHGEVYAEGGYVDGAYPSPPGYADETVSE
jgi:hypothetical protein